MASAVWEFDLSALGYALKFAHDAYFTFEEGTNAWIQLQIYRQTKNLGGRVGDGNGSIALQPFMPVRPINTRMEKPSGMLIFTFFFVDREAGIVFWYG